MKVKHTFWVAVKETPFIHIIPNYIGVGVVPLLSVSYWYASSSINITILKWSYAFVLPLLQLDETGYGLSDEYP